MQASTVIINGLNDSQISASDRGLMYGDGVFETIAIKNGDTQFWDEHIERLQLGCKVLGIENFNTAELKQEVSQAISDDTQCVIKIILTRGIGGRGYKPNKQKSITRIIQKFSWPEIEQSYYQDGIDITLCNFRLAKQSRLSGIKHLNRLEQVLARSEWEEEFQEGLVCDTDGKLIEGTSSNVFIELSGELITPDLTQCGIEGVMRKKIIQFCTVNEINVRVEDVSVIVLSQVDSIFLCNSIIGVWPVKSFDGRIFKKTAIIQKIMSEFNQ